MTGFIRRSASARGEIRTHDPRLLEPGASPQTLRPGKDAERTSRERPSFGLGSQSPRTQTAFLLRNICELDAALANSIDDAESLKPSPATRTGCCSRLSHHETSTFPAASSSSERLIGHERTDTTKGHKRIRALTREEATR